MRDRQEHAASVPLAEIQITVRALLADSDNTIRRRHEVISDLHRTMRQGRRLREESEAALDEEPDQEP